MTGGIVVALEGEWDAGSRLKGGKYVWIYDPAHDLLATVGRTGFNAAKRRSPTHLHLTVLRVNNGRGEPVQVYRELARVRKVTSG